MHSHIPDGQLPMRGHPEDECRSLQDEVLLCLVQRCVLFSAAIPYILALLVTLLYPLPSPTYIVISPKASCPCLRGPPGDECRSLQDVVMLGLVQRCAL